MDARQLRYFARIVACGSFSRAAIELHVAQPALSHHVAKLEAELGVELLIRSTRGVVPTECGTTLLAHAKTILRHFEVAAQDVRQQAESPSGECTCGLPSSASLVLTVPLLQEAERLYPGIKLKIIENHSGYLLEWVQSGHIDLAVVYDVHDLPSVTIQPLMREDLFLAGLGGSIPVAGEEIAFADLADLPLILTSEAHGLRKLVERYAETAGCQLWIKTELDALTAIKDLVASGFGYTLLPWPAIHREVRAGTLHAARVIKPAIAREVQLATSPNWPLMRSTNLVGELISRLLVELVAQNRCRGELLLKT
jgi:LysR family nitrogen assimilation transcriptional regulator